MGVVSEGVDILKLVNKVQNADLYRELAGWIDKVTDLRQENEKLREERDALRDQLRFKGTIERINGYTFVEGDDEEICPRCAEVDRRAVHLMTMRVPQIGAHLCCPQCGLQTHRHHPIKRDAAQGRNLSPV